MVTNRHSLHFFHLWLIRHLTVLSCLINNIAAALKRCLQTPSVTFSSSGDFLTDVHPEDEELGPYMDLSCHYTIFSFVSAKEGYHSYRGDVSSSYSSISFTEKNAIPNVWRAILTSPVLKADMI